MSIVGLATSIVAFLEAGPALAECSPDVSGTVTCTGSFATSPYNAAASYSPTTTLDVNSLTADITPNSGSPGVSLTDLEGHGSNGSNGLENGDNGHSGNAGQDLTVTYTGGTHKISTTGGGQGVVAISRGGNGGSGGDGTGAVGTGGKGGNGGEGGTVTVDSSGAIHTNDEYAHGILAQSIGGDGGDGGTGNGVSGNGGEGGDAAGGGAVHVISSSDITTSGTSADGIFAQSVGGKGGKGGAGNGLAGDGGDGGGTAPGGLVEVSSSGTITINGHDAVGIFAQSVGGFGGNGGSGGGIVGYGSSGDVGGAGGAVSATNTGTIIVKQHDDYGIFAQSIGGGGGNGGSGSGIVGLGSGGNGGGAGSSVTVINNGSGYIKTSGDNSVGIFAQSVGGGGGNGGSGGGILGFGGSGSDTSDGGAVSATNTQSVTTSGDQAQAIFAQSIGGGGGNGGTGVGVITFGGSGGGGGAGGTVSVTNSGDLTTGGDDAAALFAESIGGGGGNGGNAYSGGVAVSLAMGGSGGSGGNGSAVTVNGALDLGSGPAAAIVTTGDRSSGIQAQSVGGGGGNGGLAIAASAGYGVSANVALGGSGGGGGDASTVTVNERGTITTSGADSYGIFAQSVGGGGGNGGGSVSAGISGGLTLSFAMGGSGGSGGSASTVTVNARGNITTNGTLSNGVLAQSVGGGGGNGGFAVTASDGPLSGAVSLGGSGAAGGNGDTVTVDVEPVDIDHQTIETSGNGANGIFAQSVGGGGGNGGFAISAAIGPGSASVGLGGSGSGGGYGSAVQATNGDVILTHGDDAAGILAQSVGGGGGNGGFAISGSGGVITGAAAVGGSGSGGGNGGTVTVDNNGDITTLGKLSYGILAQSVGGGGGNGGFALSGTLAISVDDVPGIGVAISVGGTGGGAGDGKKVTVDNTGSIATEGVGAHAIFAQSVGGGGGSGGFAGSVAMTIGNGAAFGVSVGGRGGSAGEAGTVKVTSTGDIITTQKDGAAGIFAQSVGGGGGDGGFAFSGAFGFSSENTVNVAVAVGGEGGGGGDGEMVTVDNSSAITTYGTDSYGILAQSVGGGGGTGGLAVTGELGISKSTGGYVAVSVGGFGGDGATGGDVTVTNSGAITTHGDSAVAILAQSIGGSGGAGGLSMAIQLTGSGATDEKAANAAVVGVAIGGGGGTGNTGGNVTVNNNAGGTIVTSGLNAHGIEAQSVGGGGGNGGLSIVSQVGATTGTEEKESKQLNVAVAVGGAGGSGGTGGTVKVTNKDSIDVSGDSAYGILAQSVGGGGGAGGGAIDAVGLVTDTTNDSSRAVQISVAIGGAGGDGNNGGAVTVENDGAITTHGSGAHGIFAESIGGGGGVGGQANNIAMLLTDSCTLPGACTAPKATKNNYQLGVTIGGDGGGASNGGTVKVDNSGTIETYGDTSNGIYAQSIGGGGGDGGNGVIGSGGILPVPAELAVFPFQAVSQLHYLEVAVGGSSGSSGNGKTVTVDNTGGIITHGDDSNGILAQSVGGGGGIGGTGVIGAFGLLGVGGKGGAAGDGGAVSVTQSGTGNSIATFGTGSNGIFAQSIGGGGGVAGNVDRALASNVGPIPALNVGIGISLGPGGGGGGNGGAVTVKVEDQDTITTHGDNAAGIFAQSVGGGGGVRGDDGNTIPYVQDWAIGSNGDAGDGGAVEVDLDGTIQTSGNNATGIFAQSAGGAGSGKAVSVTVGTVSTSGSILTGAILASEDGTTDAPLRGLGSVGITAESVGKSSNGNISVDIQSDGSIIRGGRSDNSDPSHVVAGIGIWLIDGDQNTVANHGLVTTVDGVSGGYAIYASTSGSGARSTTGGDETVTNYGTVTGSFDLGDGINSFTNEAGAMLNTGAYAYVGSTSGATNLLQNDGTLSPGGDGNVFTTDIKGNWTQGTRGTYAVDLDLYQTDSSGGTTAGTTADLVNVTGSGSDGGNVDLAGQVTVNILDAGNVQPGDHSVTIVNADTGVSSGTAAALALNAPASAVATYQLDYPDSQTIKLEFAIDFAPAGLGSNETALGQQINNILLAYPRPPDGGATTNTPFAPIVEALFGLQDLNSLKNAYDQILPTTYAQDETATIFANLDFDNLLHSCHNQDGAYRFVREGTCYWLDLGHQNVDRTHTANTTGYGVADVSMATGVQWNIDADWQAGLGFGYDTGAATTDTGALSTGQVLQGGLVLKRRWGETTLATSLTGGYARYAVNRTVTFAGPATYLSGTQELGFAAVHARLAHTFENARWYVRPSFDAGLMHYRAGSVKESGSSVIASSIKHSDQTLMTLTPSLEIGGEFEGVNGLRLRPYARLGLTQFLGNASPSINATLEGAPSGVAPFVVTDSFDRTFLDVGVGVTAIGPGNMLVSVNGAWKGSRDTQSYGGDLKISWPLN